MCCFNKISLNFTEEDGVSLLYVSNSNMKMVCDRSESCRFLDRLVVTRNEAKSCWILQVRPSGLQSTDHPQAFMQVLRVISNMVPVRLCGTVGQVAASAAGHR